MKDQKEKIDYFGFLPRKWSFAFDNVKILPLEDYKEIKAHIEKYINRDGFLYPHPQCTKQSDPITEELGETIPNTERPALLFQINASHSIFIDTSTSIETDRKGQAAFLMHLLGYICGTRLQFHDWWIDMRIQIKEGAGIWCIDEKTTEHFLRHSLNVWKSWNKNEQDMITNILFMYSRAVSYEWDWDQFMIDYMVIDALFKIYKNQYNINKNMSHGERIEFLCNEFGIEHKSEIIKKIKDLRNELFHEALWAKTQPTSGDDANHYKYVRQLHGLNECLIPAILGYNNNYGKRNWFSMTNCPFKMAK